MIVIYQKILLFIILIFSTNTIYAQDKKEIDITKDEFKSTKFLHIDKFDIPKELEVIADQITQNAIDVVILTAKYTVTYTSQLPAGYNKSYLNFYSLKISIFPQESDSQAFVLKLFLYNWTTKKYDQTFSRSISKYNVLNEVRMAMYELILGKEIVIDKKDKLEKSNFERIQSVRIMIEKTKKKNNKNSSKKSKKDNPDLLNTFEESEKKVSKLKRKEDEEISSVVAEDENKDKSSLNRNNEKTSKENSKSNEKEDEKNLAALKTNELEKLNDKKKDSKITSEAKVEESEAPIAAPPSLEDDADHTPKISEFRFLSGYSYEKVETRSILSSTTNLKYLNLGASFFSESQTRFPWGWEMLMNAGIPIKKENYQLSVTKQFSGALTLRPMGFLRLNAIAEYSSLPFVNLASIGGDIKTIQNDLLYFGGGGKLDFEIFNKKSYLGLDLLLSMVNKSSQNRPIQTQKSKAHFFFQFNEQSGFSLSYFATKISGDFIGQSNGAYFLYTYSFGK